jgi:Family of unknown function (DUF6545)
MIAVISALAVIALVCWVMAGYKVRDLIRDPGNRPLRYLSLALVAVALSITVQPICQWLDQTVGVLDVGRVVSNGLALTAAGVGQLVLLHMTRTDDAVHRTVRRRITALLVALAVMVVLFLLTPARYSLSDPYVLSHAYYAATPTPAAAPYALVFLAYLGWIAVQWTTLAHRYASMAVRPLLRLGLRLITAGSVLVLAYIAVKVTASIAAAAHQPLAHTLDAVIIPLYTSATTAVLLGATLPSWGPRVGLERLWNNLAARRDCRRLRPLWTLVHQAVPHVALLPHPPQPSLRRIRMTVEILDGYVQLAPWFPAEAATVTRRHAEDAGLSPENRDAAVEAVVVALAVRDKLADRPPATAAVPVPVGGESEGDGETGAAAEVARLARVAHALHNSPAVSAALAELARTPTGGGVASPIQ